MKKYSYLSFVPFLTVFLFLIPPTYFSYSYLKEINTEIRKKFDGRKWSIPAVVYARPLELYPGLTISPDTLTKELQLAGYRNEKQINVPGGYNSDNTKVELFSRGFSFASGYEQPQHVSVHFKHGKIRSISNLKGEDVPFLRLDPARIGSFHPLVHEDRLVLKPEDIPDMLRKCLLAVEDRNFYSHHGVSPTGIIRALYANISAGRAVQGGSTLTQQLVKNFFLNSERTLKRKVREAVMALLLDYHYSKEEILTAYLNEVFLGQDGNRAVHGFGLASQFYFRRELANLTVSQISTLVGMVKGPTYYDPRKNQQRSLARRDTVLRILLEQQIIDEATYNTSLSEQLTNVSPQQGGFNRFPAFLDLVRKQLSEQYREEDLKSNGLKILTNLNPQIQWHAEQGLTQTLSSIEKNTGEKDLQGAIIITGRENGEVVAVIGDAHPGRSGFNRALDARRQIGSLVKPAIYLTALQNGYTLLSPVSDRPITIQTDNNDVWRPKNYDHQIHGEVALYKALAGSYNLAAVHLGMELGLPSILNTLKQLGLKEEPKPYPSLLLGAIETTVFDVSSMYQTIASGGFYQPLRTISSVLGEDNKILTRYGIEVEQRFPSATMFLLNHNLERAMQEGTGRRYQLAGNSFSAGKTGTSNDLKDSWFAGYTDTHLGVVWVGRDNNTPTSLTGSSGALRVWNRVMNSIGSSPYGTAEVQGIQWFKVDTETFLATNRDSETTTTLPFISGTEPPLEETDIIQDIQNIGTSVGDKAKNLFNDIRRSWGGN